MNFKSKTSIAGYGYLIIGILCIVLGGKIVTIGAICAGAALIGLGISYLMKELKPQGIALIVAGTAIILIGWLLVSIVLYFFSALLILAGIQRLIVFYKTKAVNDTIMRPEGLRPILLIVVGVLLFFNQMGFMNVIFIIIGIIFIVNGILAILDQSDQKNTGSEA